MHRRDSPRAAPRDGRGMRRGVHDQSDHLREAHGAVAGGVRRHDRCVQERGRPAADQPQPPLGGPLGEGQGAAGRGRNRGPEPHLLLHGRRQACAVVAGRERGAAAARLHPLLRPDGHAGGGRRLAVRDGRAAEPAVGRGGLLHGVHEVQERRAEKSRLEGRVRWRQA